jgi:hypothetical protein
VLAHFHSKALQAFRSDFLDYLCAYRLHTRSKIAQQICNDSLLLAQQTKQQMLALDVSTLTVSVLGLIDSQQ